MGKEWVEKVGEGGICGGAFHDLVMILLVFTKVHNWYNTKPNLVLLNVRLTTLIKHTHSQKKKKTENKKKKIFCYLFFVSLGKKGEVSK